MKHILDTIEDLIRAYFDKLLLCGILSVLIGIASSTTETMSTWAMGQANTVIGAIIMLTTGKLIERYRNGNGSKPSDNTPKEP